MTSTSNFVTAQVNSGSFDFMLKLLLSSSTPKINIPEAAKGSNNYVFLDAREYNEFNVSHILNARYVGYKDFSLNKIIDLQKDKPIIVYCSVGKRSEDITLKMKKAGYANVKNLYGGIFEWVNQGFPVYNNEGIVTDRVHAFSHLWGKWLDKGIKVYN